MDFVVAGRGFLVHSRRVRPAAIEPATACGDDRGSRADPPSYSSSQGKSSSASGGARTAPEPVGQLLLNSFISAIGIAVCKICISILSAYAVVYFRFPFKMLCFWAIFLTLMLPVEVRILPTYKVVADLGMLNSYAGLTVPLIASATATFLFRQFFLTVPEELVEAARMDGAGPMRFFKDILVPLSKTSIAALFVIQFLSLIHI